MSIPLILKAEKVSKGESKCIKAHNIEKKVTNNCSLAIFVPTATLAEWQAFLNNVSGNTGCVEISNCGALCQPPATCTCTGPSGPTVAHFTYTRIGTRTYKFTDNSTHNPVVWCWKMGDGTTVDVRNPTHVYSANGNYKVTLFVKGCNCSKQIPTTTWASYYVVINVH